MSPQARHHENQTNRLEWPRGAGTIHPGTLAGLDALHPDTLGVFCYQDVRPLGGAAGYLDWRLCGALSRALESGAFRGARGEHMLLPVSWRHGFARVFAFGLGPWAESEGVMAEVLHAAHAALVNAGARTPWLVPPSGPQPLEMEQRFAHLVATELSGKVAGLVVDTGE